MPAQPDGDVPPLDGFLPVSAQAGAESRTLSAYIHVPYCRVRCGYCDFNTYTAEELGPGANRSDWAGNLAHEVELASRVLADFPARPVSTVFFGGGTPTLLPAADLACALERVRDAFGLAEDAEVTTEANPDTLSPEYVAQLAEAGFTRVSMGMQSAVPHVLATLDRTHNPEQVPKAVQWVKDAGMQVSVDLIYGTPGESAEDWQRSVEAAVAMEPDHISAYSLIVEPGTKMGAQVRRGELPMPDEDDLADKYAAADAAFSAAGLHWYEVSNWARSADHECRHNNAYWTGQDWWGFGAGAHSHIGGVRFWNAKHPRAWADRLAQGQSPAIGREELDADTRRLEDLMLRARIRRGMRLSELPAGTGVLLEQFAKQGLVEPDEEWLALSLRGRLMADFIVRELSEYL
ncbi:Oxygen-independent coproporphyrinogen-III oxidase 1 [Brevibacterium ravenspurgense]|uniref:Heme chaperone HemW n=1 Tax=Brevibacterium ravenspurgense TaxID=479117 RepID=A0A150H7G1_9MICO|nr:radical SAM family heme chaperone HemW [Brevibacterium ravenspurgense]KXZ58026.1 Oxygen-independent coproporphyrinogen-III oxidase 1 [Brevibacterium ravenspurgense]